MNCRPHQSVSGTILVRVGKSIGILVAFLTDTLRKRGAKQLNGNIEILLIHLEVRTCQYAKIKTRNHDSIYFKGTFTLKAQQPAITASGFVFAVSWMKAAVRHY